MLFLFLCLLILVTDWPWILYFKNGFPYHWDPPFHAWKLKLVADNLLNGHLLPPGCNSNCFFPYSLTLYFEALHWPQSVITAFFLLFTQNAVLIYNIVHLLFWAMSGLCFYLLLKELKFTEIGCLWGASIFSILPYRISYLVEFNMQQCFGLILIFLFLIRFLRSPSLFNAFGLALSFWLQSISELYQAMIFVISSPFLMLPLMIKYLPEHFKKPSFYFNIFLAGTSGALLCLYFLTPYYILHDFSKFSRTLMEVEKHSLEPLSYLLTPAGKCLLPFVKARHDELSVYPTLPVLAGAFLYAFFSRLIFKKKQETARNWKETVFHAARRLRLGIVILLCVLFVWISLSPSFFPREHYHAIISALLVLWLSLSLLITFHFQKEDNMQRVFLRGFGSASIFCFILSFGPDINTGNMAWSCQNYIYLKSYFNIFLLSGMRVVSRFGIMVLIYLVIASISGWETLFSKMKNSGRWLWLILLSVVLYENHGIYKNFVRIEYPLHSQALEVLSQRPSSPLLILPFNDRWNDSLYMFQIAGSSRPLLYGWGGFYPALQKEMLAAYKRNLDSLLDIIEKIWPDPLLLLDKAPRYRHKYSATNDKNNLEKSCIKIAEDRRFALYSLDFSEGPYHSYERMTRSDYLRKYPFLSFEAFLKEKTDKKVLARISVNDRLLKDIRITSAVQTFNVHIPEHSLLDVYPNVIKIQTSDKEIFFIKSFNLKETEDRPSGKDLPAK
ncbi:MAG: hypothetical protein JW928_07935 [Candidatus Aureabacteria bacterium]|nr:hypothetical protein [Candidatus Auribacterota bacterium]